MRLTFSLICVAFLLMPGVAAQADPAGLAVGAATVSIVDPEPTAHRAQDDSTDPSQKDLSRVDTEEVDLVQDHQFTISFDVPIEDNKAVLAATLELYLDDETTPSITKSLQKTVEIAGHASDGPNKDGCSPAKYCVWQAFLSVDDPRLVVGTWTVRALALDGDGNQATTAEADETTFDIVVDDEGDYPAVLSLLGALCNADQEEDDYLPYNVTVGTTLQAGPDVTGASYLLGEVTFATTHVGDTATTPADKRLSIATTPLVAPYLLQGASLPDGAQTLHLSMSDRAGRTTSCNVDLLVDTQAPLLVAAFSDGVLDAATNATAHQGVPFGLTMLVNETSDYDLRIVVADGLQTQTQDNGTVLGDGFGLMLHTATWTLEELGRADVFVSVRDSFGNSASFLLNVTIVQAITDSSISFEPLTIPGATGATVPLAGDKISLHAVAAQDGVKPLEFLASYVTTLGSRSELVSIDTNATAALAPFNGTFRVGGHVAHATIMTPEGITETDASNQDANYSFEVFVAELIYNGTSYYVRGDARGLACYLVQNTSASSSGACDITRREVNLTKTVFEVTLAGELMEWDPETLEPGARPVYDFGSPEDPDATGGKKKAPGLWLGFTLLALVVIAARRR